VSEGSSQLPAAKAAMDEGLDTRSLEMKLLQIPPARERLVGINRQAATSLFPSHGKVV